MFRPDHDRDPAPGSPLENFRDPGRGFPPPRGVMGPIAAGGPG
jgi:hypothetical protein